MDLSKNNNTSDIAIKVESLSKVYHLFDTPGDRLKEALHPRRKKYHRDFYALRDVNFEVKKGETIGIIGQNGSGKSTLLKILSGVLTPTTGNIEVNGKVSSLLELGTGFNPELTGIENVYFNGTILGFTRSEMDEKLDDILSFADIGEFVYQPVKTYSSGMYVRLAFAVAVQVNPDILIVDEALAVGDTFFQVKSMNKMLSFVENGKTVIFVSHDSISVKTLCRRAILLQQGSILMNSTASSVVDYYNNMILNKLHKGDQDLLHPKETQKNEVSEEIYQFEDEEQVALGINSINTGEVDLLAVHISNLNNQKLETVTSEEDIKIVCKIRANTDIPEPHFGFILKNRLGISAFETNTYCMGNYPKPMRKGELQILEFHFNCNLGTELYSVSIGVTNKGYDRGMFENYYLLAKDVAVFKVVENVNAIKYTGYYNMKPVLKLFPL